MTIQKRSLIGLDGVPAAETALSHVDGERGDLVIAGSRVEDLALAVDFETLTARLWSIARAEPVDAEPLRRRLGEARVAAFRRLPAILAAADGIPTVPALRAALAALRPEPGIDDRVTILGALPVMAAALARRAAGEPAVAPDAKLGQAADTLRMLRGTEPTAAEARALDAYFVTVSDHGMNASTFAGRVVASTLADLFMTVTAAYCALTGPLHGGAPEPVLEMLDAIGKRERIAPWIDDALARGQRIMGFGHRIYRVRDPRADVLRKVLLTLGRDAASLGFAAEVEAYARDALARAKPDRRLETNVEFYTAILLDALAVPRQAFTPLFATARAAGWIAHGDEQRRLGRLLRPSSLYTGAMPG